MRWFKHFSDNNRGRSIQSLLDKHGHMGPCCLYFLMEMCSEKLEKDGDNLVQVFTFHEKLLRQVFRTNRRSFLPLLETFQELGLVVFRTSGNFIEIEMPILLNLLDRDLKKTRQRRANDAPNTRLELDKELDSNSSSTFKSNENVETTEVKLNTGARETNIGYKLNTKEVKTTQVELETEVRETTIGLDLNTEVQKIESLIYALTSGNTAATRYSKKALNHWPDSGSFALWCDEKRVNFEKKYKKEMTSSYFSDAFLRHIGVRDS